MSWNYDTEWQLVKLKHLEDLEQAHKWRLQQGDAQWQNCRPNIMQPIRTWLGHQMIALGNQLANIPQSVQPKVCSEC